MSRKLKINIIFFRIPKITLLFIFISVLVLPNLILNLPSQIFASQEIMEGEENLEVICQLEEIEESCQKVEEAECRKLLEKCEQYYREKSVEIGKDLDKTEQEKKTLQNKIYTLSQTIKNLDYQINQSNIIIKDLGIQLDETTISIDKTTLKIEESKEKLSNILRTIYEEDQKPAVEILLSEDELSDFFDNLVALGILNSKGKELLQNIKSLKSNLEYQEKSLDGEKDGLEQMVKLQAIQKKESAKTKQTQEYYLGLTEQEYQKYLQEKKETEKKTAEIRNRLFELIGVAEGGIEFGKAVEIAKSVEKTTKVRSAFLLAIIAQESMRYGKFGENVGQCYLKNRSTGEGIIISSEKTISRVMKPMGLVGRKGDVDDFITITEELGRDPYNTPVSCPMSYGYGGAMGPAQFIPTTWMWYREGLKQITGRPGDPWNIKDAFLAAGLYLADYGAAKQTFNGEWKAAMIYFSGTSKRTKYNGYGSYGDSVMRRTAEFQADIEALEGG